jgi:ElaB/YqjD/DUF883 family membrane-anchored ribosome-binding protein
MFHPGRALRLEAQVFGDWFLRNGPEAWNQLAAAGGGETPAPAALKAMDEQKRDEMLKKWIEDYRQKVDRLADAMEKRYAEARERIEQINREVEAEAKLAAAQPETANPLVALAMPGVTRIYAQCAMGQAQADMARIACAACLFKARSGAYPPGLKGLNELFPAGLPKDPFTGRDYAYRLDNGLPYVACDAPEDVKAGDPERWSLSLSRRRAKDKAVMQGGGE